MLFGFGLFGCAHFCIMCHSVICYYLKGSAINPHDVMNNGRRRAQWAITIKKSIDFNRHTNLPYPREIALVANPQFVGYAQHDSSMVI